MKTAQSSSRRIIRNSAVLYIRMILATVIGLYSSKIVLQGLGVEDFGLYNLVGGLVLISSFLTNSLTLAVDRFLAFHLGKGEMQSVNRAFMSAVYLHIFLMAALLLLGETLGLWFVHSQLVYPAAKASAVSVVYQTSIAAFLVQMMGIPFNSWILANERMDVYALVNIVQNLLRLGAALLITYIGTHRLEWYAAAMIAPGAFYTLANMIYVRLRLPLHGLRPVWDGALLRHMTAFATYSSFGNMATSCVAQGQSVLLNVFYGPLLNAVKGIGTQVNVALTACIFGIYTAVNPPIIKAYAQGDSERFRHLLFVSTKAGFIMLAAVAIPMLLEMPAVLTLWLDHYPDATIVFVRWVLINALVANFVTPSWMAIQATGKVRRVQIVTGLINLSNLPAVYFLWKGMRCAPESIMMVNVALSLLMQIATLWIQRSQLQIGIRTYLRAVVVPSLAVALCALVACYGWHVWLSDGLLRLAMVSGTSMAACAVASYAIGFGTAGRQQVHRWMAQRIK